jgi:hypothetical protein
MHPNFLREEAARFRGMAESQDREASKQRLLKMAADYEAKADAGGSELPASKATEPTGGKGTAKDPNEAV